MYTCVFWLIVGSNDVTAMNIRRAMLRLSATGGSADLNKEKMRAAFDMVDVDKNGNIDAEELVEVLRKLESDLSEVCVRL